MGYDGDSPTCQDAVVKKAQNLGKLNDSKKKPNISYESLSKLKKKGKRPICIKELQNC